MKDVKYGLHPFLSFIKVFSLISALNYIINMLVKIIARIGGKV